jgi:PhoH-like ATPase
MGKLGKCVIDTNVLLESPEVLDLDYSFILPIAVIEELDGLKKSDEIGWKARRASHKIENSPNVEFVVKDIYENVPTGWNPDLRDNKIILTAVENQAKLFSNDLNVRIKAKILGVDAEKYTKEKKTEYTGYIEVELNHIEQAWFYENIEKVDYDMVHNQYLLIKDADTQEIIDKYKWTEDNGLVMIKYSPVSSKAVGKIKPINPHQELLFDMLQDKETTIKVCTGKFGTGKDFCMLAHALNLVESEKYQKLIWVRNPVQVRNSKDIGFLPGTANEKLMPFASPMSDHLGGEMGLKMMIDARKIELQHFGFIRGRDIKNSIIYCSEAENFTKEHIQLLIGRVGEGSIIYFNGDFKQTDEHIFASNSGLNAIIDRLSGNKLFGFVKLDKVERSDTAALSDLLD